MCKKKCIFASELANVFPQNHFAIELIIFHYPDKIIISLKTIRYERTIRDTINPLPINRVS